MKILAAKKPSGFISLVLHAHLPYVRYPEHEDHLEERWLYEAMTETYIPLLEVLSKLLNDRVDFRITLSLTPTLIEMFRDELLMQRYGRYLDRMINLSEEEVFRTRNDSDFGPLARMYRSRFRHVRDLFEETYGRDIVSALRSVSETGQLEIIACPATHPYLPALVSEPVSARTQIIFGVQYIRTVFGNSIKGMWLPECGFSPVIDPFLAEAGIGYFFVESHGVLAGYPQHPMSIYRPVITPSGVSVFARDAESSKQVWSSVEGYPGDFDYRDFYRDIGFDRDMAEVEPYLSAGIRNFTGIKYYRITGKTDSKKPYRTVPALRKAGIHARHFIDAREKQVKMLGERLKSQPVVTAAYDAELFGHWWFEGLSWLDSLFRTSDRAKHSFKFVTPSEYLAENKDIESAMPSMSSWGFQGYSSTWISESNSWIYCHLNRASRTMEDAVIAYPNAVGLLERALNQALRELFMAQASDWPFMMNKGNASEFGRRKFEEHITNFFRLQREISNAAIDPGRLLDLESRNNLFADLDFRIYHKGYRPNLLPISL